MNSSRNHLFAGTRFALNQDGPRSHPAQPLPLLSAAPENFWTGPDQIQSSRGVNSLLNADYCRVFPAIKIRYAKLEDRGKSSKVTIDRFMSYAQSYICLSPGSNAKMICEVLIGTIVARALR